MRIKKDSGAALVIVLLLLTIMAALVADFLYRVRVNSYLTGNQLEQVRAKAVAQAGINAAHGLLLHSAPFNIGYRGNFQNQFVKLFNCRCYSETLMAGNTAQPGQNPQQQNNQTDNLFKQPTECGEWSLVLEYPLDEDMLRLEIFDEAARLNLNGLVLKNPNPDEEGAQENLPFKPIVRNLLAIRLKERGVDVSEEDLDNIMTVLVDWLDYGSVNGALDKDQNESYEDGDRIYSNKNGPMDTVSELRMIPGINEEIYYTLKDFFTVYPMMPDQKNFSFKVNFDLASLAVVYALVRGTSYSGEVAGMDEQQAMDMAVQMVEKSMDQQGFLTQREVLPELRAKLNTSGTSFLLNAELPQPRYYRLVSSGITPSGINYTIEAVVKVTPGQDDLRFLYWHEG